MRIFDISPDSLFKCDDIKIKNIIYLNSIIYYEKLELLLFILKKLIFLLDKE
jgi:hypothetical protein